MVEFGDRLRKLRKERKLTQKELASLRRKKQRYQLL